VHLIAAAVVGGVSVLAALGAVGHVASRDLLTI